MGRKLHGAIDGGGIVMHPGIREQQDAYASLQVESLFEGERVIDPVKALALAIGIGPEVARASTTTIRKNRSVLRCMVTVSFRFYKTV